MRVDGEDCETQRRRLESRIPWNLPSGDRHVPCPSIEGLDARNRPKVDGHAHELLARGGNHVRLRTASRILGGMKATTLILVGATLAGCTTRAAEQPAPAKLTIENLIDIKHPSNPMWSPDG